MTSRNRRELLNWAAKQAVSELQREARGHLRSAVNFAERLQNVTARLAAYAECMARADRVEQDILADKAHRHPLVNEFIEEG